MKLINLFIFTISLPLFLFFAAYDLHAARFTFDPITQTIKRDTTFDVRILVDTGGVETANSDALVSFNKDILTVIRITGGEFYPENLQTIGDGSFRTGGTVTDPTDSRSGQGVLATITFRGQKLATAQISFICIPGETSESNITKNDPEGTDILDCNQLVAASYTITEEDLTEPTSTPDGSIVPTATPTITTAPTPLFTLTPTAIPTVPPTATPLPANIPESGYLTPTIFLLTAGAATVAVGFLLLI